MDNKMLLDIYYMMNLIRDFELKALALFEANKLRGQEVVISGADSKVKVAVIPTNEELAIAKETLALI